LGHRDKTGAYLDGGKAYKLGVPQPVPAGLFWSVTVYDAATRSQVQTAQKKAALRSMFEKFTVAADGAVDLYFGPKAPAGKEGQWVPTQPAHGGVVYFRIYAPQQAAFEASWRLGEF